MYMEGRIKIHRKIDVRWWRSNPNDFSLFLYLLTNANTEEKNYQWHIIKKWDCVTWRKSLALKLWISEDQIRTSLEHLKSTNEITIKSTNHFSIITVCKWEEYQIQNKEPPTKSPTKSLSDPQPIPTPKEYKNIIIKKEDILEILSQEEINKNANQLFIIWKMIENWYSVIKNTKELIDLIEWVNQLWKDYLPRKEDWCLNWEISKKYIRQWEEYFKTLPKAKRNYKLRVRDSFSLYSTPRWK